MRELWLKKACDRRIARGHLWVFSNEVDTKRSPLTQFLPGEAATVLNASGNVLGSACVNPATLICARLHSRLPEVELDVDLLTARLTSALTLRETLFSAPWYRLCHGEGDLLPGLVIDRYGSHLALQITTSGMERRLDQIRQVLQDILKPESMFFDNDLPARVLEGLDLELL